MFIRLWAFMTGGRLVWLKDADGEIKLTIAYTDPWGELRAERYWPNRVRSVRLLPDGRVDGAYVVAWKDA